MKNIFTIVFCLLPFDTVTAQVLDGEIRGKILTYNSKPFSGASVSLKGTKYGQTTGDDGSFSIKAPVGPYTLMISTLNNEKKEIQTELEAGKVKILSEIRLKESAISLDEFVVTGQFEAQTLKNSVYQVRTIDSERIRLRGATNLQTILSTELGMRFSNDLTLGTSDIQLMGMSGQNVKILLDGVPMVDRGSTRESIGQIDINTVERIEIVEGPMSVIYGSDALAGVINIITKKGGNGSNLSVKARVQEETVGKEYNAFQNHGTHNQNLGITWLRKRLQLSGNVTSNNFGGWQGDSTGRKKAWMPKDQMLYTASIGYKNDKLNVWYRFNGADETIKFLGYANSENKAGDADYVSKRWFHQVQGDYKANEKLSFTGAFSYTDYSRRTLSTQIDLTTGRRTLDVNASQDKSIFTTTFFRGTTLYKASSKITVLAGIDITNNNASGARIIGTPTINEFALFIAPEIKLKPGIKLTPGLRFLENSIYDAPPVIPSLNGKIAFTKKLDFRFGYARGFRSPALRELYFLFKDASHDIIGNVNLKAEYSNSFNSSLVLQTVEKSALRISTTLGGFYNVFHDLITTATIPGNASQSTYLNIDLFKTTGITLDNKLFYKNLQATIGGTYIGRFNQLSESSQELGPTPQFTWSPEINSNILYSFPKVGASINLFYKFSGKRPSYETVTSSTGIISPRLTEISGFHAADLTATKTFNKYINIIAGTKNLFNVTNLLSTTQATGAHSSGSSVPNSYERSYFIGLNVQWSKN